MRIKVLQTVFSVAGICAMTFLPLNDSEKKMISV
ncbi:hypothetical protein C8N47_13113 [Mangrovibacterium marinum]|uniref:Uncharacterized protein n=1 Tax=Mangrovibacterium marinum TaxID=1639118 RepID=A0A2T5BXB1_9BACT|nr:hypothetical protein C8N47_13113 [Mangrovibacterium marinum]